MTKQKAPGVKRNYYTITKSDIGEDWLYCFGSHWLFSRIFGRVVSAEDVGQRVYMHQGDNVPLPGLPADDEHTTLMLGA